MFIGANATIMYGVTIGNNCIVAANAVVTRNVLAGSVVAGIPARVIGTFDSQWKKFQEFNIDFEYKTGNLKIPLWDRHLKYFYE